MRTVLSLLVVALTACSTTSSQMRPTVYEPAEVPAATARVNEDRILEVSVPEAKPVEDYLAEATADAYKMLNLKKPPHISDKQFVKWLSGYSQAVHEYVYDTHGKADKLYKIREKLRMLAEENSVAREMLIAKLNELDYRQTGITLISVDLMARMSRELKEGDQNQVEENVVAFRVTQKDLSNHVTSADLALSTALDYFANLREVEIDGMTAEDF